MSFKKFLISTYHITAVLVAELLHTMSALLTVSCNIFLPVRTAPSPITDSLRWLFGRAVERVFIPQGVAIGIKVPRRLVNAKWVAFFTNRVLPLFGLKRFAQPIVDASNANEYDDVFLFQGVPYATILERFAAPVPLPEPHDAAKIVNEPRLGCCAQDGKGYFFGSASTICAQLARLFILDSPIVLNVPRLIMTKKFGKQVVGSEFECLQLNVWAPRTALRECPTCPVQRLLPVFVFFHGGAFVFGSSHLQLQTGENLAAQGKCVVFSANYRLGSLGYLKLPNGESASNCGLRDQLEALRWIKKNAKCFGGDPENITISGQSAGAMSCGALMGIPTVYEEKLAHKVMLISGTGQYTHSTEDADDVYSMFVAALKENVQVRQLFQLETVEEGAMTDEYVVKLLKNASIDQMLKLQAAVEDHTMRRYRSFECGRLLAFGPFYQEGDDLLPQHPVVYLQERIKKGLPLLPVIAGTTDQEYTFFTRGAAKAHPIDESKAKKRIQQWTKKAFVGQPNGQEELEHLAERVEAVYKNGSFVRRFAEPYGLWNALNGDWVFRIPTMHLGTVYSSQTIKQQEAPLFMYRFDTPSVLEGLGAAHVLDLHFWFGNLSGFPFFVGAPYNTNNEHLSQRMIGFLKEFCHARTSAELEVFALQWPVYDAEDKRKTLILGVGEKVSSSSEEEEENGSWRGLIRVECDPDSPERKSWGDILSRLQ